MAALVPGVRLPGRRRVDPRAFDLDARPPPAWEVLEGGRQEIEELCCKWRLSAAGRVLLLEMLESEPVYTVESTPVSSAVRVPSTKMGRMMQSASRTEEYTFLQRCEFDPEVLLYLDQPKKMPIRYFDAAGRRRRGKYTPDYLVVRRSGPELWECKPVDWLRARSQTPDRAHPWYLFDIERGVWRYPAAEKAVAEYGFTHHVFCSRGVDAVWVRNLAFLRDFMSIDPPPGIEAGLDAVGEHRSLALADAFEVAGTTREAWYWLIANARVAFDFERHLIDSPHSLYEAAVHFSHGLLMAERCAMDSKCETGLVPSLAGSSNLDLRPGRRVVFREMEYSVASRNAVDTVLAPVSGSSDEQSADPVVVKHDQVVPMVDSGLLRAVQPTAEELVAQASRRLLSGITDEERRRAAKRWSAVCEYRETGKCPDDVSARSLFQYLRWAREALPVFGSEFLGMVRPAGRARERQLSCDQLALVGEVGEAYHRGKYGVKEGGKEIIPSRKSLMAAYADYVRLSKERGLATASSRTFRRELKKVSIEQSERRRRGRRAAYPFGAPVLVLKDTVPVHGTRPYAVAHVDHQQLDVWCRSGATGALLGRPWLTLIFDAYARYPLGFALRFDAPSAFSVSCAIYDVVLRHGRFVDLLVSDRGAEFSCLDLGLGLAYLDTHHLLRPPTRPRFGSLIERVFGSIRTRLIQDLRGSVETVARARELSSSHDPKRDVRWTLPGLSALLEKHLFETYPKLVHGELGATPAEVFDYGGKHAGERVARRVAADETLELALSRTIAGGTRRAQASGAWLRAGYLDFHHPALGDARVAGRNVPVRLSPGDASFVFFYAPHLDGWERARLVTGSIDLTGRSWKQALALIEERGRQRLVGRGRTVEEHNALVLSGELGAIDEEERLALERRMDVDAEQNEETEVRVGNPMESESEVPALEAPVTEPMQTGFTTDLWQTVEICVEEEFD